MRFANPLLLLLLAVPAGYALLRWWRRHRLPAEHIAFPTLYFLAGAPATRRVRWRRLPAVLRLAGLACLVVALARPQTPTDVREIKSDARNIVVALDISSSMKAGDFKPGNRLAVARRVLTEFAEKRQGDLIGLVIFAGRAFLQAPLTADTELLGEMVEQVDIGLLPDGTAIGTALAMSLNQLKDLPVQASVVVLITDGANNTGDPTPFTAAEAARALGIRIHTIGLSSADTSQVDDNLIWRWGRTPDRLTRRDELVLKRIAERTGGRYYRATDPEGLQRIVEAIDPLERVEVRITETRDYRELYVFPLAAGMILLSLELGLGLLWLRTLP